MLKRIWVLGDEEQLVVQVTARVDVPTVTHPSRLHDERIHCTFDPSISLLDSSETGSFLLCACDARSTYVDVWDPGPCPSRFLARVFAVFFNKFFF